MVRNRAAVKTSEQTSEHAGDILVAKQRGYANAIVVEGFMGEDRAVRLERARATFKIHGEGASRAR
jgi:hypothetical protein